MKRLDDIQAVNSAEVNLVREQSALLLQKRSDGFSGEMKSSGAIIENYVKGLVRKHIPNGYRICSGYIATVDSMSAGENLVQHDIIIVDDRIPPIYSFGVSDIEVVPAESVCGIIEVKRTLTRAVVKDAIAHLRKTHEMLAKYSDTAKGKASAKNNFAGPTLSVATTAPMYAIIGLDADGAEIDNDFLAQIIGDLIEFVDMIWSPATDFLCAFAIMGPDERRYVPQHTSRVLNDGFKVALHLDMFPKPANGMVFRTAVAFLRTWINNTSGSRVDLDKILKYFPRT